MVKPLQHRIRRRVMLQDRLFAQLHQVGRHTHLTTLLYFILPNKLPPEAPARSASATINNSEPAPHRSPRTCAHGQIREGSIPPRPETAAPAGSPCVRSPWYLFPPRAPQTGPKRTPRGPLWKTSPISPAARAHFPALPMSRPAPNPVPRVRAPVRARHGLARIAA